MTLPTQPKVIKSLHVVIVVHVTAVKSLSMTSLEAKRARFVCGRIHCTLFVSPCAVQKLYYHSFSCLDISTHCLYVAQSGSMAAQHYAFIGWSCKHCQWRLVFANEL